ncbi:hypothetical protein SCA6_008428 [Theobroma cacao]
MERMDTTCLKDKEYHNLSTHYCGKESRLYSVSYNLMGYWLRTASPTKNVLGLAGSGNTSYLGRNWGGLSGGQPLTSTNSAKTLKDPVRWNFNLFVLDFLSQSSNCPIVVASLINLLLQMTSY